MFVFIFSTTLLKLMHFEYTVCDLLPSIVVIDYNVLLTLLILYCNDQAVHMLKLLL